MTALRSAPVVEERIVMMMMMRIVMMMMRRRRRAHLSDERGPDRHERQPIVAAEAEDRVLCGIIILRTRPKGRRRCIRCLSYIKPSSVLLSPAAAGRDDVQPPPGGEPAPRPESRPESRLESRPESRPASRPASRLESRLEGGEVEIFVRR